jgi:chromosome segregation ATPase
LADLFTGREIMSASVEIVFDNADSRFPVDKEEVKRFFSKLKNTYMSTYCALVFAGIFSNVRVN